MTDLWNWLRKYRGAIEFNNNLICVLYISKENVTRYYNRELKPNSMYTVEWALRDIWREIQSKNSL